MTTKWFNGEPFELTQDMLALRWSGHADGRTLRCQLCGEWLKVGEVVRFVLANFAGTPCHMGNFFVCAGCDGADVLERAGQHEADGRKRHWWMLDREHLPHHPDCKPERRRG